MWCPLTPLTRTCTRQSVSSPSDLSIHRGGMTGELNNTNNHPVINKIMMIIAVPVWDTSVNCWPSVTTSTLQSDRPPWESRKAWPDCYPAKQFRAIQSRWSDLFLHNFSNHAEKKIFQEERKRFKVDWGLIRVRGVASGGSSWKQISREFSAKKIIKESANQGYLGIKYHWNWYLNHTPQPEK